MFLRMYTKYVMTDGTVKLFCYWTENKLLFWDYSRMAYEFHSLENVLKIA